MFERKITLSVLALLPFATTALELQKVGDDEGVYMDDSHLTVPGEGCCQFWHTGRFDERHYNDPQEHCIGPE